MSHLTAATSQTVASRVPQVLIARAKERGFWGNVWRRLRRDRAALLGGALVLALIAIALLAPWITPYDPLEMHPDGLSSTGQPQASTSKFLLGTDKWGRDLLTRIIYGAQTTLMIGILGSLLAVVLGVVLGAVAGYVGGWVESVLMRFTDIMLAIPKLLLAMALVAILKPSVLIVILVVMIANWTYVARIVYGEILRLKQCEYILAARAVGVRGSRILLRHMLPHLVSIIIVYMTLGISTAVMLEAALGFLGLGVPPPTPTWGTMVSEGQNAYRYAPWLVIYPGFAILITVLAFNLLGDGLRDALDPHQWK